MIRRLAPLPLLAVLCAAQAWAQPCTPTLVTIDPEQAFQVPTARFDTTGKSEGADYQISFDLRAGTLESRVVSNGTGRIEIDAVDRFWVEGLAKKTEVDAVLEVTAVRMNGCGLQCAWAMTRLELRDEASGRGIGYLADTQQAGVYHFEKSLSLVVNPGEPFTLSTILEIAVAGLGANLDGRADLATRLRFDRVPVGTRVRSCRGFNSDPGTPVAHRSWGAVKALYR